MTCWMGVPGTWDVTDRDEITHPWWHAGSAFTTFMTSQGFTLIGSEDPWRWTGNLVGGNPLDWIFSRHRRLIDWEVGGTSLRQYLCPPLGGDRSSYVPIRDRNLIAHSHGGNVVMMACASGLKVNALITVGTPVRKDMHASARAAREHIGAWLHLYSDGSDWWQWLGELFDGHFGIVREFDIPGVRNELVLKIGHSRLLQDPACFSLWTERQWLEMFTGRR